MNPGEREILGFPAYPSVLAIPHPVDMAVVVTPTAAAPGAVRECVAKGVRTIIINTAGFAEAGPKGKAVQEEMAAFARVGGARLIGPNCIGIYCPASRLPFLMHPGMAPGPVGLVSQSGFFADHLTIVATGNGVNFSKAISCGNESDLNAIDFLRYLGEDPETRTVVAYIESIKDGRAFYDAARAISLKKPVILLRGGLTEGGARAAVSHTGALAGARAVWEGAVRHAGIVTARSFEDVLDCLYAFHLQPLPAGNRMGIISAPGGIAVTTTDACLEMGLAVPQFTQATANKLRASMPLVGGSVANPIDLSLASVLGPHVYRDALRILLDERNVDMLLVVSVAGGEILRDLLAEAETGRHKKKPIAVAVMSGAADAVARDCRLLVQAGIPAYPDALRAAKALRSMWEYAHFKKHAARRQPDDGQKGAAPARGHGSQAARSVIKKAAAEGRTRLSGHESTEILRAYAIPTAREIETTGLSGFRRACTEIGFPLAVKATGADVAHKTEQGLVYVNIANAKEALAAYRQIVNKRKGRNRSVLVQEMVGGARELIAGMVRDSVFGPCVMVGLGGVFSEALADKSFRAAPVSRDEALDMLGELKGRAILGPFRGMPACDTDSIADIIVKVAAIGCEQPEIAEIDINPLIISGAAPVAVDALIVLDGG